MPKAPSGAPAPGTKVRVHATLPTGTKVPLNQFIGSMGAPDTAAAITYQTGVGFTGKVLPPNK